MTSPLQSVARVAFVDADGILTRDGMMFLRQLYTRAGGSVAMTNVELAHAADLASQRAIGMLPWGDEASGDDAMMAIPGPAGAAGAAGSPGPPGGVVMMIAEDGLDGDPGPPGAQGSPGSAGATGATGPTGATGAMGPAVFLEAEAGDDGPMGPPGATGAAGAAGSTGATGATGAQGPAGPAIYLEGEAGEEGQVLPRPIDQVFQGTAVQLSTQALPGTPAAGQVRIFGESVGKRLTFVDDAGKTYTLGFAGFTNFTATLQGPGFATDTYVTGSSIAIPASLTMQVGTRYVCRIFCNKNANGVAAPVATLRIGTNGTTADAAILTFTGAAQTAANDTGVITITMAIKTIGSLTGVAQGTFELRHNKNSGAGLSGTDCIEATSGSFNTTVASLIIGVSLNYGTSVAMNVTQVQAELINI